MSLNYDEMIMLDAEELAEGGIKAAYEEMRSKLLSFQPDLIDIEEAMDPDAPSYFVRAGGETYLIYSPENEDEGGESWGRAAYALFSIINKQLSGSTHLFYALYGGNDLGGIFLTPEQAEDARESIESPEEWPYLPRDEGPWYGQHH